MKDFFLNFRSARRILNIITIKFTIHVFDSCITKNSVVWVKWSCINLHMTTVWFAFSRFYKMVGPSVGPLVCWSLIDRFIKNKETRKIIIFYHYISDTFFPQFLLKNIWPTHHSVRQRPWVNEMGPLRGPTQKMPSSYCA